ncbi:MAG: hypothetical protein VKJ24_22050 [Synechococcales bacterium]|nr:hypothetical protein [Synechococcales bacterium]
MTQSQSQSDNQWQITLPLSISDLMAMIAQLPVSAKYQLRDFLDDELEDDEDSPEDLAEIQKVYAEYESGDYVTLDDYLTKRGITL